MTEADIDTLLQQHARIGKLDEAQLWFSVITDYNSLKGVFFGFRYITGEGIFLPGDFQLPVGQPRRYFDDEILSTPVVGIPA